MNKLKFFLVATIFVSIPLNSMHEKMTEQQLAQYVNTTGGNSSWDNNLHSIRRTYNPNKTDRDFLKAVISSNLNKVRESVGNGANINAENYFEQSALILAVKENNMALAHFLIQNGANINCKKDWNYNTPLRAAVEGGNLDMVRLLLKQPGIKLNHSIRAAAFDSNVECMQELLKHPQAKATADDLSMAIAKGAKKCVALLLARSELNPNEKMDRFNHYLIFHAIDEGDLEIFKLLYNDKRVNREQKSCNGESLLHAAACRPKILKFLLKQQNVKVNELVPEDGFWTCANRTPLQIAVRYGCYDSVKMLLAHPDINVNANVPIGELPGFTDIHLKYIVDMEDDSNKYETELAKEKEYAYKMENEVCFAQTALHFAAEKGFVKCMKELLKHPKINVNPQITVPFHPYRGQTPLHLAASKDEHATFLLLFYGSNPAIKDKDGKMPKNFTKSKTTKTLLTLGEKYTDLNERRKQLLASKIVKKFLSEKDYKYYSLVK